MGVTFTRHAVERYLQRHLRAAYPTATLKTAEILLRTHWDDAVQVGPAKSGTSVWWIATLGIRVVVRRQGGVDTCLTVAPSPFQTEPLRQDEIDWFYRVSDDKTVLWMASGGHSCLWHATTDGVLAVCSSEIHIHRSRDPYPSVVDRSADAMTCLRCATMVRRVRMPRIAK